MSPRPPAASRAEPVHQGPGTPNIGAIEEYERVNGRYTYLSDQRADVEQAKGELTGVIDQLTQQMKNRKGQQAQQAGEETETQE